MWFEHSERIIALFETWEKQSEKNYDIKSKDAFLRLANFIYWIGNVKEGQEYVKRLVLANDPEYIKKSLERVKKGLPSEI